MKKALSRKRRREIIIIAARDAEWSRIFGVVDRIMTPQDGEKWLENDRIVRARYVSAAQQKRGPFHW